jgi:hypothetical protein
MQVASHFRALLLQLADGGSRKKTSANASGPRMPSAKPIREPRSSVKPIVVAKYLLNVSKCDDHPSIAFSSGHVAYHHISSNLPLKAIEPVHHLPSHFGGFLFTF